ncbi:hypothetical protein HMSSN139_29020 [Paenibacillus sp. HMSSN-139]|nr:hypothetical protein HMSSN139_29020 [Paenibacillus sp. HMSSN-139]
MEEQQDTRLGGRKQLRNGFHSINHRLFLLFLFCMSGILLIVSLLYYNRTTEQYHEKISDLSQKNVAQTAGLFSLLYEGYDSLSKSITNNFEMIRLLNEKTDEPAVAYINEQSITNIIGAIFIRATIWWAFTSSPTGGKSTITATR